MGEAYNWVVSICLNLSLTRICASSPSPSHLSRHCQDGSAETHVRRWRPLVRRHSRRLCWYLLYGSWRHAARQFKRFFLGDQEKGARKARWGHLVIILLAEINSWLFCPIVDGLIDWLRNFGDVSKLGCQDWFVDSVSPTSFFEDS